MSKPKSSKKSLKIALVHDYLREYGGAERVLEALHEMYPEAPVYVAFCDSQALGRQWDRFRDWDIRETWLSRVPGIKKLFSPLRILAPRAFASLDMSEFDVVISSTNAYMAKAVRVPHGKHICYCHTPPRALYGYATMSNWKKRWWIRIPGEIINHVMRVYDFKTAQAVDMFVANSKETARRISKFYRRESRVIYPPVSINQTRSTDTNYYLYVNRLAFAKHPELAVRACNTLKVALKVVGTGPMLSQLQQIAGPTVSFMGSVSDEELHELYAGAKALVYPVEDEDFGIVPIEAMGHGVPVVAHKSGGPLETIIDGKTGVFFDKLNEQGLIEAISQIEAIPFNTKHIQAHAQQFSKEVFKTRIAEVVSKA